MKRGWKLWWEMLPLRLEVPKGEGRFKPQIETQLVWWILAQALVPVQLQQKEELFLPFLEPGEEGKERGKPANSKEL